MILTSIFVDLNPAGFVRKVVVLGVICTHQSAQSELSCTFVQSLLVSGSEAPCSQNAEKLGIRTPIGHSYREKMQ